MEIKKIISADNAEGKRKKNDYGSPQTRKIIYFKRKSPCEEGAITPYTGLPNEGVAEAKPAKIHKKVKMG
ncbi:MAG TPA: hypothetical protein PLO51_02430 [Candidatus Micrarchaeota archaeon]|nr:hypothetical protein [Candidatus Micrarchaeota archaeon]